jgi:hypothetical protein
MNFSDINWIGVLLGSAAGFLLGALWYGPIFGKVWMAAAGITKDDAKKVNMPVLMGSSFLTYLVLAVCIVLFLHMSPECDAGGWCWMDGAKIGAIAGLACATGVFNNGFYEMKSKKLLLINGAYSVINGAVMGAVIAMF